MQRGKHTVEILEFIYAMILFLPIFLIITKVDGGKSFLILLKKNIYFVIRTQSFIMF